jgi:hypothetical protein
VVLPEAAPIALDARGDRDLELGLSLFLHFVGFRRVYCRWTTGCRLGENYLAPEWCRHKLRRCVFATASGRLIYNNRFSINSLCRRRAVDDGSEGGREEIPSFRLQCKLAEAVLLRLILL